MAGSPDTAAKEAFAAGDYEAAARLYSALLERKSASEQRHLVLCNRSAALLKLGRHADAAVDARAALEAAPAGFVKAHYRLACALKSAGDFAGALAECEVALRLRPGNEQLTGLREVCLSEMATRASLGDPAATATAASGAPGSAAPGMLDRARQSQALEGSGAAPITTPGVVPLTQSDSGERYLHGAPPARSGMLDRARAARKSLTPAGGAAAAEAAAAAADAGPAPSAAAGGMLARARAAREDSSGRSAAPVGGVEHL